MYHTCVPTQVRYILYLCLHRYLYCNSQAQYVLYLCLHRYSYCTKYNMSSSSLLTARYLQIATHSSLLLQLTTYCSLLPAHYLQLAAYSSLLTLHTAYSALLTLCYLHLASYSLLLTACYLQLATSSCTYCTYNTYCTYILVHTWHGIILKLHGGSLDLSG